MFDPKHLDFHFPLFTTSLHMLVQFSLSALTLYFFPQFRPRYDSISNPHNIHAADGDLVQHEEESKKPLMTKTFYVTRIGPCGIATGLDIGLGNMSLKYITLTFYSSFPYPYCLCNGLLIYLQRCVNHRLSHSFFSLPLYSGLRSLPGVLSVSLPP